MTTTPDNQTAASVALDAYSTLYQAWRDLEAKADEFKAAADHVKHQLQTFIGDAEQATIDGHKVLQWRRDGQFAPRQFTTDHPELARQYTRAVTVKKLDVDALKRAHPDLYAAYRARRFVPVDPPAGGA